MNSIIVALKSGDKIEINDVSFNSILKDIESFVGENCIFITIKDFIFVINNIEYIKRG